LDVFKLRDRLVGDYAAYVGSFIRIKDARISEQVKQCLDEGLLVAGAGGGVSVSRSIATSPRTGVGEEGSVEIFENVEGFGRGAAASGVQRVVALTWRERAVS
jgi:hypothetical protein